MKQRQSTIFAFLFLAHMSFLIKETVTSSDPQPKRKNFLIPKNIENADGPIAENYVYVDKTKHILDLLESEGKFFFIRPHQFGKSSFLQTVKKVFEGRKDIFPGTHIHESNYTWDPYPVLYLDFGDSKDEYCQNVTSSNQTRFERETAKTLAKFKADHGLLHPKESDVVDEFANILIEIQDKKNLTVVLIDNYDSPVLSNTKDCVAAEMINKHHMEDIFKLLKSMAGVIKFAFVTGVSKSVFESSIDLKDISNDPKFHGIAGITELDLKSYYAEYVTEVAKKRNLSNDDVIGELKNSYDGHQFAEGIDSPLYNPSSVHGYFEKIHIQPPKINFGNKLNAEYLFHQMVKRPDDFSNLNLEAGVLSDLRSGSNPDEASAPVLMYGAGYLTIEKFQGDNYLLRFPNLEMEKKFYKDIAEAAMHASNSSVEDEVSIIGKNLKDEWPDFHALMVALNGGLTKLQVRLKYEKWYHHVTRNFMDQAHILFIDMEPRVNTEDFGVRKPDIIGYDRYICFLFEIKFERPIYQAYEQANKSIKTFLESRKLCPLRDDNRTRNLLAAGITFTSDMEQNVVQAYQAKLFAGNGQVLDKYLSKKFHDILPDSPFYLDELFMKPSEKNEQVKVRMRLPH